MARQLQADPEFRDTPIVFLSVNTSFEGEIISGGILSGYSFVANPVRIEEFVRYVGELFSVPTDLAFPVIAWRRGRSRDRDQPIAFR